MTIREKNIDRFDAFLAGRLIGEDQKAFEQELKSDEALSADFETYKAEVILIKTVGIREEMGQVMANKDQRKKSGRSRWLIPLSVAAALVLVFLFIPEKEVDNRELFEEYFRPYPNAIVSRADESSIGKALNAYEQGAYDEAISLFKGLNQSDTVRYYAGVSHLALEQPEDAIGYFRAIEMQSLFNAPSIWYKGLTFLIMDRNDSAAYYLKQVDIESPNYPDAQELLHTLGLDRK